MNPGKTFKAEVLQKLANDKKIRVFLNKNQLEKLEAARSALHSLT